MMIEINVDDLHRLLTEAGVESNDAKAIIYDLILIHGGPKSNTAGSNQHKRPLRSRQQTEVHSTPVHVPPEGVSRTVIDKKSLKTPTTGEQYRDPQHEEESQPERARVRTHKRLDFSGFGGESQGLRDE